MPHPTTPAAFRSRLFSHARALGLFCALAITPSVGAQSLDAPGDPFNDSPASRPIAVAPVGAPLRPTKGLTEFATEEPVAEIRVRGNTTIPESRITGQMQTRVGRPFDPRALAADIKKLAELPYFVTVRPLHRSTPGGRVIVLEVVERRALRYVEYLGNERIGDKKLAETTGLAVGGAIDPYAVTEGKRKIEAYYREKGFGRAHVEVIEGESTDDQGVVYAINEGSKQKIWAVKFEGNRFASDGQLKTKVKSKPNLSKYIGSPIGGKLNRELLDLDVEQVTSYYRAFGFFRARVGRLVELDDSGEWATIRFAINEGPRYQVRNVTINGVEKFQPETVRSQLELGGGDSFEQSLLQKDLGLMRDLYGSHGYIFADIKAETVFLEEPGQIDLVYNVTEGERWRVGKIQVNINGEAAHTRIQTALNRMTLRPGDILDTRKLRLDEQRLGRSQLFNTDRQQGSPPKISWEISEETKRWLAERAEEKERKKEGVFRGQSPSYSAAPSGYQQAYPSAYQIQQSEATTPERALSVSGTPYAAAPPPANNRVDPNAGRYLSTDTVPTAYPSSYPSSAYGGSAVGATDPSSVTAATAGAPVYQLGAGEQRVTPTQYGQPLAPRTYGQPAPPPAGYSPFAPPPPPTPVNTQVFPTQVYAPTPVPPPNDPFADLVVNLQETQTGRFMVGVAVNSDAGLVGQIMLDERNFDWLRWPRGWRDVYDGTAFRGAGQRFRLEAAPGTEVQRYVASWQEPYLFDTPISLSLSGSFYDRRFDNWDEQRLGGRVGLGYQWVDRDLSGSITYRGEKVNIHNATPDLPDYAEVLGDNFLHGFGVRLVNDRRNNPFFATEGYYVSLALEQVIGSFDYGRAEIDARTYMLIRERPDHTGRHVMSFQTRVGFTGDNTPVYDRFYAGGFSTLRGYDFRGASPQVAVGGVLQEVGGDFMFINSLEYIFPLTADDMINGVAFVDHGTVNEEISLDNYRVAPGFGLRIVVPAMGPAPIALDFAFPLTNVPGDEERVFTFNVGLQR